MHVDDASLRDFLLDSGLLSRRQLSEVENTSGSLYQNLARGGVISPDELRRAVAGVAGVPFVVLDDSDAALEALVLIPEPVARTHSVAAFATRGSSVEVAMLDLDALEALQFLQIESGFRILPRLTTGDSIKRALLAYHKHLKERFGERIKSGNTQAATEALLAHALLHRANSVHLEQQGQSELLARYRIGGHLYDAMTLPREAASIPSRLKELASLSHTLMSPQEGSFKVTNEAGEEVRIGVATMPTVHGERTVLHVTTAAGPTARKGYTLTALGFHGAGLERMHAALARTKGLVVVLGSGKTTLLYTMLDMLGAPHRVLASVEDEIAFALPGVAQTAVQKSIGLDMAAALRAVLRQDPDIVMIDTIADSKTATLAQSAAKRGMLVVAASNDAIEGADVVIQTRVVRRVCQTCKESYKLARAEAVPFEAAQANFAKVLAALKEERVVAQDMQWKELTFARATGCGECEGGYKGHIGLQEVHLEGQEEGLNLAEEGLFKAAQGLTTIEEVGGIL